MRSNDKIIIGLTGYYCSGKSEVSKILKNKYKFDIIEVDKIGHSVLDIKKEKLANIFGKKIINKNKVDRKILGAIVFKNKNKLNLLNSILHPIMIKEVEEEVKKSKKKLVCINAALLFQMQLHRLCTILIFVKSSIFKILKRARIRDNSGLFRTIKIINSQKNAFHINRKLYNADIFNINNNNTLDDLKVDINSLLKQRNII